MDACGNKVILLGTGCAEPNPRRMAASHLLCVDGQHILADCGPGTAHRMAQCKIAPSDLSVILLTHLHASHCSELPGIVLSAFLQGRQRELPIYGPVGLRAHVAFLFEGIFPYIPAIFRASGKSFNIQACDVGPGRVLKLNEELQITCARANHGVATSLCFRVETSRGSVGLSGDTAPCGELVSLVKGVDLLIHECSYPDTVGSAPIHTLPSQLGVVAARAGARRLALTHLSPMCDSVWLQMIEAVAQHYNGDIIFGEDLMNLAIA